MAKGTEKGHPGAHTRGDPAAIDAPGGVARPAEALPGADPLDLLAGSPDLDPVDLFAMAAEPALHQRRARGRPEGSLNRKNNDMIRYLAAKGHRDPWETLSLIQSADTARLAAFLGSPVKVDGQPLVVDGKVVMCPADGLAVASLQERAATTLMKYHHSAKPQQLELPAGGEGGRRPIMVIGDGNNVAILAAGGYASAEFLPPQEGEQNQEVIEAEAVRQSPDQSQG